MPKRKLRYLIRFNEKNANGRIYLRDSIVESALKTTYWVHNGEPESSFAVPISNCCGMCQLKINDFGVYMDGFKFLRDGSRLNKPLIENAKIVTSMLRKGVSLYPVTASVGNITKDGVIENCEIISVFFTSTPSFEQSKKNQE